MKHRPFEEWLLDDLPLNPTQKRDLDGHLRACPDCAAIAEANLALRTSRLMAPAAGFTARWQERLVLARRAQRRRTLIGTLVFSLGGLALLVLLVGPILLSLIGSPAEWITALVSGFLFVFTTLVAVSEAGSVILRMLPNFIPPFAWLVLFSTVSGLTLLWSVSIWRLIRRPQGAHI